MARSFKKLHKAKQRETSNPRLYSRIKKWQIWKFTSHAHLRHAMGHSEVGTKLTPGPGGINCGCCTRFSPEVLKIKSRRVERRRSKQQVTEQAQMGEM